MPMIWNSGMGTPMPSATPEPGREYSPTSASGTFNYDASGHEILSDTEKYQRYIATIERAMQASSGWERIKLQAQREDAQKGLDNAIALERMRAQTSRYGTDAQTRTALAQLQENQRQFDANHGLAVADSYTRYASTPDDLFQLQDLKGAVNAASSGGYQQPLASQAASGQQPHAKTWQDYAALAGYGPTAGGGASSATQQQGGGSGNGGDKRLKAMRAVSEAMPPSDGMGHDRQDWAAIDAIKSLYFSGRPGDVESLDPIQQREAQSGLRRAGYNAEQVVAQRRRSLPGQYAASAA